MARVTTLTNTCVNPTNSNVLATLKSVCSKDTEYNIDVAAASGLTALGNGNKRIGSAKSRNNKAYKPEEGPEENQSPGDTH